MKSMRMLMVSGLFVAMLAFDLGAAEPTKEEIARAEVRSAAVNEIGLAADLAAYGREAKSPESLVLAGGILLRAGKTFGGKVEGIEGKVVDEKGQEVKGDSLKTPSLEQQAETLFTDASALALLSPDKERARRVEAMISAEKKVTDSRASVGSQRAMTRMLNVGETHTVHVAFQSGQEAIVVMTSTGPARIQFDISQPNGSSLFSLRGLHARYSWTPPRDKDALKRYKITLTNEGRNPTTYTLNTN